MKKIKLRFSYFILMGLIGFVLQFVSFFSFTDTALTASKVVYKNATSGYVKYITSNIVLAIGTLLIIAMLVGYAIGKKKENNAFFKFSLTGALISESSVLITTLVYIIFSSVVRVNMFATKTKNPDILSTILLIRMIGMTLTYAFLSLFSYGILTVKKCSTAAKILQVLMISVNFVGFVLMVVVLVSSKSNDAYRMLTNLYHLSSLPPYKTVYHSPNGFTLAQLTRLSYVSEECAITTGNGLLVRSASLAMSCQIMYLVAIGANFIASLVQFIESFDISRDQNLMEI